ncbi:hypothetical protein [Kineosporia sp. NBRC 101731]|uniref:hypothetical protein n=1 Tax=Kineosporia sp. NBRC 101731 TaxID=3032199 RepID=UPI0025571C39|nr:hypothetical protein [Kineosporia sp. NBRC 101731]
MVALIALERAGSVSVQAASPEQTRAGADPAAPTTAAPDPTTSADPISTEAEPTTTDEPLVTKLPSPGASYAPVREDVQMRLVTGDTRYVDLDQPLVNAESAAYDVAFSAGFAQPTLRFESADVAVGKSPTITPDECAQEIQLSPVDAEVEVSQDLVLCAVTNGLGAVNEPARTKMARIVINSVSKDNAVNLTVTTWEIPR